MQIKNNQARIHSLLALGTGGEAINLLPQAISRVLTKEEESAYLNAPSVKALVNEGKLELIASPKKAAVPAATAPAKTPGTSDVSGDELEALMNK